MHDGADSEQIVAVVFPGVNVPTGASVDAAQVVFMVRARPGRLSALSVSLCKSDLYGAFVWARGPLNTKNGGFRPGQIDEVRPGQSDTAEININIYGDLSGNSAAPSTTDFDLSSRTPTSAAVSWTPEITLEDTVGDPLLTPDISEIVSEIIALPAWSAGNSMGIMFGHVSGAGVRWVESSQANAAGIMTPALSVTYSVGGGGGATTDGVFTVGSPLDSGEEEIVPGTMYLDSSDLELMHDGEDTQQIVGVVFPGVTVPQGSSVTRASVVFEVDEVRPGQSDADVTISIYGEAGPAAAISTANFDLSSRTPTSESVTWQPEPTTAASETGASLETPDISTVVAEIVGGSTWTSGSNSRGRVCH
jgi:type IV pilus assembly protein PilY1